MWQKFLSFTNWSCYLSHGLSVKSNIVQLSAKTSATNPYMIVKNFKASLHSFKFSHYLLKFEKESYKIFQNSYKFSIFKEKNFKNTKCVQFLLFCVSSLMIALSMRLRLNLTGIISLYERHFFMIYTYALKFTTFIKAMVDLGFKDLLMASFSFICF